ncbi:MAG: ubiquinol-cytochrome C chaperone [Acidisphaera sp.]|nr:ubiquinol-cytochrome C chaperone [Acidisphaera sp.]
MWQWLRRKRHERAGYLLYGAGVAAARSPVFYSTLGVPDTLDGRFELISVHAFLLIRRLRALAPPGPALAQAVFDAMFSDMDASLREMGVGDLSVGKRMRVMWEGFHGRAVAYETAMQRGNPAALPEALIRNVWRGVEGGDARALARLVLAQDAHLAHQGAGDLLGGHVTFLAAEEAAR